MKSQFGTMCKPLHAGHAAATGLQSANLAARGFSSCNDILEAPRDSWIPRRLRADEEKFATRWRLAPFTQDICFKYHAACYLTHSAIEATRELCQANLFDPNDIDDIEVRVDKGHLKVCNIPEPPRDSRPSSVFGSPRPWRSNDYDTASIELFDDALTREPDIVRFRDKVRVLPHEISRPETVVTITTVDGDRHEAAVNVAIPMRDLDAQWGKLERKFLTLATPVLGSERSAGIATTVRHLNDLANVSELTEQLSN